MNPASNNDSPEKNSVNDKKSPDVCGPVKGVLPSVQSPDLNQIFLKTSEGVAIPPKPLASSKDVTNSQNSRLQEKSHKMDDKSSSSSSDPSENAARKKFSSTDKPTSDKEAINQSETSSNSSDDNVSVSSKSSKVSSGGKAAHSSKVGSFTRPNTRAAVKLGAVEESKAAGADLPSVKSPVKGPVSVYSSPNKYGALQDEVEDEEILEEAESNKDNNNHNNKLHNITDEIEKDPPPIKDLPANVAVDSSSSTSLSAFDQAVSLTDKLTPSEKKALMATMAGQVKSQSKALKKKTGAAVESGTVRSVTLSPPLATGSPAVSASASASNAVVPTVQDQKDAASPASLAQYKLHNTSITQDSSSAYVDTNQLLISRLSSSSSQESIIADLVNISNLMGVTIDIEEYKQRVLIGQGIFQTQTEDNRCAIIVHLTKECRFHTLGALRSECLPIFIFTRTKGKGNNTTTTTKNRLTIQAIPSSPLNTGKLHEVVALRGFPDNCHMASSLLPILMSGIMKIAKSESLLFVFSSSPNLRYPKRKRSYVDELMLRVFTSDKTLISLLRSFFGCVDKPVPCIISAWRGLISPEVSTFAMFPTNIPELVVPLRVMAFPGATGDLLTDVNLISPYVDLSISSTLPAGIGYIRGNIDNPQLNDAGTAIFILPPTFDSAFPIDQSRWDNDHPTNKAQILTLGYSTLSLNFTINPVVAWPKSSSSSLGKGIFLEPVKPSRVVLATPTQDPTDQTKKQNNSRKKKKNSSFIPPSNLNVVLTQALVPVVASSVALPPPPLNSPTIPPPSGSVPSTIIVTKSHGDKLRKQDQSQQALVKLIQANSDKTDQVIAQADRDRALAAEDRAQAAEDRAQAKIDRRSFNSRFDQLMALMQGRKPSKKRTKEQDVEQEESEEDQEDAEENQGEEY